jgi:hypothetical protein
VKAYNALEANRHNVILMRMANAMKLALSSCVLLVIREILLDDFIRAPG